MALPEITGWQTESLRVTLIANEPVMAAGKNWFKNATGIDPHQVTHKPSTAEYSESAPFLKGQLELRVSFNRVDWLYTTEEPHGPVLPTLGDASEVLTSLIEPIEKWLNNDDTLFVRAAVGPVFFYAVDKPSQGTQTLLAYLPFLHIDPEAAREVFMQINFPSVSKKVEGLELNRLCKFRTIGVQIINVAPGNSFPSMAPRFFCRAELDFSTDGMRTIPLPAANRMDLVNELHVACREILNVGVGP
ncbi:hypothetical protein [Janthinobacterium sp. P210006]|uniref:hypothetical protein n=1 Tax=Janthinobacterium sp. P210006 TaxID=3112939 RepID=UPI002E25E49A|nr:hypothetical protein [Janthinobacterium sp. P210006]